MSLVIEGGTIVAADRTYKADVLIEGETIKAIGEGLKGDSTLDAKDCFVLPGGIDPHTHLDMPFMARTPPTIMKAGPRRLCPAERRWWSTSVFPIAISR